MATTYAFTKLVHNAGEVTKTRFGKIFTMIYNFNTNLFTMIPIKGIVPSV